MHNFSYIHPCFSRSSSFLPRSIWCPKTPCGPLSCFEAPTKLQELRSSPFPFADEDLDHETLLALEEEILRELWEEAQRVAQEEVLQLEARVFFLFFCLHAKTREQTCSRETCLLGYLLANH